MGQEGTGSGDGPGACTRLLSVECPVDIELSGIRCLKNPMKVVLWKEGFYDIYRWRVQPKEITNPLSHIDCASRRQALV